MLRNAAVVLGNQRAESALPVLRRAAQTEEPIVREACEWAIERILGGNDDG
jgi:epoxyqueuosine reductase QueG